MQFRVTCKIFCMSDSKDCNFLLYFSIILGGIILFLTGFFACLIIFFTKVRSCSPANDTETPPRPALAVLPTLIITSIIFDYMLFM